MRIKVLIVGKNSFIGKNIYQKLKRKLYIVCLSFENVKKKKQTFFKNFKFIINCSINSNYILKKYKKSNDIDLFLAKKYNTIIVGIFFYQQERFTNPS
jgi:N-acetyl-gamma-glutamylphosphate reductase